MIPGLAARLRERWRVRFGRDPNDNLRSQDRIDRREQNVKRQLAAEYSMKELQEFLEGDLHPDQADPEFKQELRDELWQMIQARTSKEPGSQSR